MGKTSDSFSELLMVPANQDQRHRIPSVGPGRKVFDVAMITCEEQYRVRVVKVLQDAADEAVQPLEDFDGGTHLSTVACIVGEKVLKQCEVIMT